MKTLLIALCFLAMSAQATTTESFLKIFPPGTHLGLNASTETNEACQLFISKTSDTIDIVISTDGGLEKSISISDRDRFYASFPFLFEMTRLDHDTRRTVKIAKDNQILIFTLADTTRLESTYIMCFFG